MSTDRDTTRIVRSWLELGATSLPDRVLDAVLDQVPATPQRRPWWPSWRSAHMTRTTQLAIAAAAVVVVAVAGYNLLPGQGTGGPPVATPTVAPSATPAPSPTGPTSLPSGPVPPGTYLIDTNTTAPFTITVPPGWTFNANGVDFLTKGGDWTTSGVVFTTWIVSHVYVDSCSVPRTLQAAGTKSLLAAALAAQTGHQNSGATEVTLGGRPASHLEFALAADFRVGSCAANMVRLWPDAGPDENGGLRIYPGQTTSVYVLDASDAGTPGATTVVVTIANADATATDLADLQAILDSIQFLP